MILFGCIYNDFISVFFLTAVYCPTAFLVSTPYWKSFLPSNHISRVSFQPSFPVPRAISKPHVYSKMKQWYKTSPNGLNQSINQSIERTINQSINQSINQTNNQSINQSINQTNNQSINQSIDQSINQSNEQSINQSVNQSINQSINQNWLINQSINQLITDSRLNRELLKVGLTLRLEERRLVFRSARRPEVTPVCTDKIMHCLSSYNSIFKNSWFF